MKKHILYLRQAGLAAAALLTIAKVWSETPQQPNIILFMIDDMGWHDTSEPFWTERIPYNDLCHTPRMERLSRKGVKFTQAYACAISSPTRTSLMTGMNAAQHRVTNWTLNEDMCCMLRHWCRYLKKIIIMQFTLGKHIGGSKSTSGADLLNLGFDVNIAGSEIGGLPAIMAQII